MARARAERDREVRGTRRCGANRVRYALVAVDHAVDEHSVPVARARLEAVDPHDARQVARLTGGHDFAGSRLGEPAVGRVLHGERVRAAGATPHRHVPRSHVADHRPLQQAGIAARGRKQVPWLQRQAGRSRLHQPAAQQIRHAGSEPGVIGMRPTPRAAGSRGPCSHSRADSPRPGPVPPRRPASPRTRRGPGARTPQDSRCNHPRVP